MKKVVIPNSSLCLEIAKLIAEGESVSLKPKGNSMLPFIRGEKDCVLLVKPDDIKLFDVVLACVAGEQYVLHRVVKINGNELTLMGDGNLRGCEICSVDNVVALAIEVVGDTKQYKCRDPKHIWKVKLWQRLQPIRRYLLVVYRLICKIS